MSVSKAADCASRHQSAGNRGGMCPAAPTIHTEELGVVAVLSERSRPWSPANELALGIIVLVVGLILARLGAVGHAVGGRRHYW